MDDIHQKHGLPAQRLTSALSAADRLALWGVGIRQYIIWALSGGFTSIPYLVPMLRPARSVWGVQQSTICERGVPARSRRDHGAGSWLLSRPRAGPLR